jgi:hypothetical protein
VADWKVRPTNQVHSPVAQAFQPAALCLGFPAGTSRPRLHAAFCSDPIQLLQVPFQVHLPE